MTVLVVFCVTFAVEQENERAAPGARSNAPAPAAQDGSTASASVMPVSGTSPVFVAVIRQYAVEPVGPLAVVTHGPGPSTVQSAGSADWQTSLASVRP